MDLLSRIKLTEQLYKEFDHICWFYRVKLRQPLIVIDTTTSFYGRWDPLARQLTLSEIMIQNHSWDIVLEVFKHEMAHQIVHEIFEIDSSNHDEYFRKACDLLAVEHWARSATGDLPEVVDSDRKTQLSSEEESLLRRIEKLLNLAQSTNEHEASLAMQRVHELYQKHQVHQFADQKNPEFATKTYHLGKKRVSRVQASIFSLLNEHYSVRIVYADLFDAEKFTKFKTVEMVGTSSNLQMADYVYEFLNRKLNDLWKDFFALTKNAKSKNSYCLGVIRGFDHKLGLQGKEIRKSSNAESKALTVVADQALQEFVELKFPRLHRKTSSSSPIEAGAFHFGMREGKQININRPISKRGGFGGFLT